MVVGRALHYVFKIGDRKLTAKFYKEVLGMKVLRHEEFSEGCEAACNGPYAGRWSKTMVGYGPEDTHFAVELTYNYGIHTYERGNDFLGITIRSKEVLDRAKLLEWPIHDGNVLEAPGGYRFIIIAEPQSKTADPVVKVSLASTSIEKSVKYWNGLLGLKVIGKEDTKVTLGYGSDQANLEFIVNGNPINRAKAYGRIAFSCTDGEQDEINDIITKAKETILTPLVSLDTPGKATVRVIILADPDGHEICFVNDAPFRELSQVDPAGDKLLMRYIDKDAS